jgi:hypothetical protein
LLEALTTKDPDIFARIAARQARDRNAFLLEATRADQRSHGFLREGRPH